MFLAFLGCEDARQGPCRETIEKPLLASEASGIPPTKAAGVLEEPRAAKLVHLVTFELGPMVESLEGYMIVRAPDALRLYGMTESGQRAFDVAWVSSGGVERVNRIYRAPFLRDDRVLDQIAKAAARLFLLRVPDGRVRAPFPAEERIEQDGVAFFYGGAFKHLCWTEGDGFAACFMDWRQVGTLAPPTLEHLAESPCVPTRIHYEGSAGPFYSFRLTLKLVRAETLAKRPPDSLFEPKKSE